MELAELKNGTVEDKRLVSALCIVIANLSITVPIAFYELVMMCRDQDHKPFGLCGEILRKANLIRGDNSVHDSIRNVVMSGATGDVLDLTWGSPFA